MVATHRGDCKSNLVPLVGGRLKNQGEPANLTPSYQVSRRFAPLPTIDDARRTLREVFGYDSWRPGQERAIASLLAGRSSLAIFPTGGGKSLCYQLPALLLDGLTVVVSPLIALMKDQVDDLTRRGVAAARLDSSLAPSEARRVRADLASGRLKILYVAPERLASERFVALLQGRRIALLAVDEAHCISEWGHNFRPEYLKLAALARKLQVERVLALTATATPEVADSIARSLRDRAGRRRDGQLSTDPTSNSTPPRARIATGCPCSSTGSSLASPVRRSFMSPCKRPPRTVARTLRESGVPAEAYHAGLGPEIRHEVQDRFMRSSDGVVVATIAFGMGIDKADIRTVIHFNLPKGAGKLRPGDRPRGARRVARALRPVRRPRGPDHARKLRLWRHPDGRVDRVGWSMTCSTSSTSSTFRLTTSHSGTTSARRSWGRR